MALTESRTISEGGLTALVVPRQLNPVGLGIAMVAMPVAGFGKGAVDTHSRASMGRISYDSGMARMTSNFQTNAVPAMMEASHGNYSTFSGMAQNVVTRPGLLNKVQDHGATPDMIAALYHMGGK